ncbi:MAG: hypothetical protein ACREIC_14355 [Limisphaerales bacterium]
MRYDPDGLSLVGASVVSSDKLEALPWQERLLRYHQLSEEAFREAAHATTQQERDKFLSLGNGWYELATETEKMLRERR